MEEGTILEIKYIDIPPKTYYKINDEKLSEILKNSVVHEMNNKENML